MLCGLDPRKMAKGLAVLDICRSNGHWFTSEGSLDKASQRLMYNTEVSKIAETTISIVG